MKLGRATGCNEIRHEVLKALDREVLWLTQVCQASVVLWKGMDRLAN